MSEFRGTMAPNRLGTLFNTEVEIQSPLKKHGPCQLHEATPWRSTTLCCNRGFISLSLGQPGYPAIADCRAICTAA